MKFREIILSFLFIFLIFYQIIAYSQDSSFEIILNSEYDENPVLFKLADNGNFIGIINKSISLDSSYISNSYIYKISPSGDTNGWKIDKQDTTLVFYKFEKLTQNIPGFLLMGTGRAVGEDPMYPFTIIIRIDNNMNVIWEKIYRFNYYYGAFYCHALELVNGDLLYGCSVGGGVNMFLFKMSDQGDSLNFASWTGTPEESGELWDLTYNMDSTAFWMHTEWAYYQGSGGQVSSIVEVDTNLQYISHMYYPESFRSPYNSILYSDNKLITGGSSMVPDIVHQDIDFYISVYILDSNMEILHEILLTNPDTVSRAGETQGIDFIDPSCIFIGGTHNLQSFSGQYPSWMYISKLNDTLGLEYEKYIGGDAYYWLTSVTASPDGGVLLASTRQDFSPTFIQNDAIIIKLDANGNLTGLPEKNIIPISDAIVYPNPGKNDINIRTALNDCTLILFNSIGRKLLEISINQKITTIPMVDELPGMYPYSLVKDGDIVISGIWIKN
jgi:hypothetical protein